MFQCLEHHFAWLRPDSSIRGVKITPSPLLHVPTDGAAKR
jgi:hypothetical protein